MTSRLRAACRLLEAGRWAPAEPSKLGADFDRLGLILPEEQLEAVRAVAAEVNPEDYVGRRPPERSYEPATPGAELFAFAWRSRYFGRSMYFKFSICGAGAGQRLFVYSLHPWRRRVK